MFLSLTKVKEMTQKGLSHSICDKAADKVHQSIIRAANEGRSSIEVLIPPSAIDTIKVKLQQKGYRVFVGEEGYRYNEFDRLTETDEKFVRIDWN